MESQQDYQKIKSKLSDRWWRLNNLYYITDKEGKKIKFRPNWAQEDFYNNLHYVNVNLKARQLGFTTFTAIYFLDACLFNSNHKAGIIAHTLDDAQKIFKDKVKFAYDCLPQWLKDLRPATSDNARTLEFSNKSSIYVGTSLRGGTFQKLLVSEYGKISAKYPDKATEIKTGALNTVAQGQQIIVESTAEGKVGEFFKLTEQARKLQDVGRPLARIEPKFFFYSWWQNPEYRANEEETRSVVVGDENQKYFSELETGNGIVLTSEQKAWYVLKKEQQGEMMPQEYPSTPEEAFQGSLQGAFYTKQMREVRKRGQIRHIPYNPKYQVFTWWDLGTNDLMTTLFYQYIDGQHLFIDYHEASGEGWEYYAKMLLNRGYNYGKHFFPHDGNNRMRGAQLFTDRQMAEQCGIRPVEVTNRSRDVWGDIQNHCIPMLPQCHFDAVKCEKIINHLDAYRRKWSKADNMFMQEEQHDEASHGASAFRTFAVNPELAIGTPSSPLPLDIHSGSISWMG